MGLRKDIVDSVSPQNVNILRNIRFNVSEQTSIKQILIVVLSIYGYTSLDLVKNMIKDGNDTMLNYYKNNLKSKVYITFTFLYDIFSKNINSLFSLFKSSWYILSRKKKTRNFAL